MERIDHTNSRAHSYAISAQIAGQVDRQMDRRGCAARCAETIPFPSEQSATAQHESVRVRAARGPRECVMRNSRCRQQMPPRACFQVYPSEQGINFSLVSDCKYFVCIRSCRLRQRCRIDGNFPQTSRNQHRSPNRGHEPQNISKENYKHH
jgi:hypothetical protein